MKTVIPVKTFSQLFDQARKSPAYWLEGVIIEIGEYLHSLKVQPYKTEATKAKILAVKKCLSIAEKQMKKYEAGTKSNDGFISRCKCHSKTEKCPMHSAKFR